MTDKGSRSATSWLLWFLVLWTPVLLLFWVLLLVQVRGHAPALELLRAAARLAVLPGVGGVGIWLLSGVLPWPERRPTRFIVVHIVAGLTFAALAAIWFTLPLFQGVGGIDTLTITRSIVPWQLASNLFLYGLIAGGSYAVRGAWGTRDQRLATERAERLRAQAELAALRAHINPHFLFNTLHSVTQLLRREPERAEAALDRLSELFRYALRLDREGIETVSLEDEWRFAESYLWLERMRMGNRLCVEPSLTDDALLCAVPPFTLQPLVENAVRHGLSTKVGNGILRINASEANGVLTISVSDNGVGADASALEHGAGLGLRAVRQRLTARHGVRSTMAVAGSSGQGVRVTITLPAEQAP